MNVNHLKSNIEIIPNKNVKISPLQINNVKILDNKNVNTQTHEHTNTSTPNSRNTLRAPPLDPGSLPRVVAPPFTTDKERTRNDSPEEHVHRHHRSRTRSRPFPDEDGLQAHHGRLPRPQHTRYLTCVRFPATLTFVAVRGVRFKGPQPKQSISHRRHSISSPSQRLTLTDVRTRLDRVARW